MRIVLVGFVLALGLYLSITWYFLINIIYSAYKSNKFIKKNNVVCLDDNKEHGVNQ